MEPEPSPFAADVAHVGEQVDVLLQAGIRIFHFFDDYFPHCLHADNGLRAAKDLVAPAQFSHGPTRNPETWSAGGDESLHGLTLTSKT